jgi:hypothetical protein
MRLVAATGLGMIGGTTASAAISKGSSKPDAEESLDWAKVRAQFDLAPGSVHQADIALGMVRVRARRGIRGAYALVATERPHPASPAGCAVFRAREHSRQHTAAGRSSSEQPHGGAPNSATRPGVLTPVTVQRCDNASASWTL